MKWLTDKANELNKGLVRLVVYGQKLSTLLWKEHLDDKELVIIKDGDAWRRDFVDVK